MNQFGLVQAVDGFSQCVVIAVAFTSHRGLDARFGQTFAVPNGYILRPPVAVVNQSIGTFGLAVILGLLQCVQHKVCSHGAPLAPTHNLASVDVNHKGHVLPALPGRDIREVRHPQLMGTISLELPIDSIQWESSGHIAYGRAQHLAAPGTLQAEALHQPLDGAARYCDALAPHLLPDLVSSIDPHIGLPDPLNLRLEGVV